MRPSFLQVHGLPVFAACCLVAAGAARAQLDFGSPEVSESDIDRYAGPFYKLMAAPLGSGRLLPQPGSRWSVGLESVATPIPDREPFQNAERGVWPAFRVLAGGFLGNGVAGARGMAWNDPRLGTVFTYGANLSYASPLGRRFSAVLQGGWDHLHFGSAYSYRSGTLLGGSETVPGDYTLREDAWGATAGAAIRSARHRAAFFVRSGPEITLARLRYLYYPSSGPREAHSSSILKGWRNEAGAQYHGFRLEAGYHFEPYVTVGWSWNWR